MSETETARAKGVWVYSSPVNPIAEEAKKHQRHLQEESRLRAAERREHRYNTMPNRVCYADTAFKDWKDGDPIPKCNKCRGKLYPEEHHDCPGFRPRYRTDGLSRDERMEMRRASWDDWDDDQYDETTPDETTHNLRVRHEAETGNTYDQVVIEGMTEDEYLMKKFGYIPNFEDFGED
jgi:hypothetical protein